MYRTNIEWVLNPDGTRGFALNPLTGCTNCTFEGLCLNGMFPCYAWKLANGRLKAHYLANDNIAPLLRRAGQRVYRLATERGIVSKDEVLADPFYPRFWSERLKELTRRNDMLWADDIARTRARPKNTKPIGIFLCDMSDLFGIGVPVQWTGRILDKVWGNKGYDRIYTLTKQAQNLPQFSPFPENCWVGVTVTKFEQMADAVSNLAVIQAGKRFISFEPLLTNMLIGGMINFLDWVIIGACTGTYSEMWHLASRYYSGEELTHTTAMRIKEISKGKYAFMPKIEWVEEIVRACDKAGVKVFLKDNLKPLLIGNDKWAKSGYLKLLRQELPQQAK